MRSDFHAGKIIVIGVATVALGIIGFTGLLRCSRDNPLDAKSKSYIPGTPPDARFLHDTLFGFIKDSIKISIAYSDTEAAGGKPPKVEKLYFNWAGDSTKLTDSVTAVSGDSMTVMRYFASSLMRVYAYVRAKDNDGMLSPAARMKLVIDSGIPKINSMKINGRSVVLDTVASGQPDSIAVSATDTNGTVKAFIFTVSGKDTVIPDSLIRLAFDMAGTQTVIVKVRDDDSIVSRADTVTFVVMDTTGPLIQFLSPPNNSLVTVPTISVLVSTKDPSGTVSVLINGNSANPDGGPSNNNVWQLNVGPLTEGPNTITAQAWDNSSNHNQSVKSITVTYKPDTTPPAIAISTPLPNSTISDTLRLSPVTIAVSVTDLSGVAWVKCNTDTMQNVSGSSYTVNESLPAGNDTMKIIASDTKGNIDTVKLPVVLLLVRDTVRPFVHIIYPRLADTQIAQKQVQVRVRAHDSLGPIISGIDSVTVDGLRATFTAGHYVRDNVPLNRHGYDTIRAVAVDSSGNLATDSVVVIQNVPPHFVPDNPVKNVGLPLVGVTDTILVCVFDTENDPLTLTFLTRPVKSSSDTLVAVSDTARLIYKPNSSGLDTFTVKVTDNLGGSATLQVRVYIGATNPYFTNDSSKIPDTAYMGIPYIVQLNAVDPNIPPLSLVYSLGKPPTPAGASIDTTGKVTWTPTVVGKDTIVAIVKNTIADSGTIRWPVIVLMPDRPPKLQNPGSPTITEGKTLQFTVAALDSDSDTLRYSFGASYPTGATLDSVSGVFSWTPTYKQGGVPPTAYPTVFRVTEKNRSPALSDSVIDTIFVRDTNMAPVLVKPHDTAIYEMELLTFALQAMDIDGDGMRDSVGGAQGAQMVGNQFYWRPTNAQGGVYQVNFYVIDSGTPPLSDSAKVIITVIDTTVPVFTKDSSNMVHYVQACAQYRDTLMATDADNDSLTYKKLSGPAALTVGKKGVVTWVPSIADISNSAYIISATVEDPYGNKDTLAWTITVLPRWPKIYPLPTTNDTGFSVIQISGGYAVCGTISASGLEWPFLMTTDTSGNAVMIKTFGGLIAHATAYSLQQTTDGGFILCGTDSTAAGSKLLLIKTTAAGDTQWTARYSHSAGLFAAAKGASVCLTSDGGYLACGTAVKSIGSASVAAKMYLLKTDGLGKRMWDSVYYTAAITGLSCGSAGYCVSPTPDGGYIASGEITASVIPVGEKDIYLVKIDAYGKALWTKSFAYQEGSVNVRNTGLSVQAAGDGTGYYIGGFSLDTTLTKSSTALVIKRDINGDSLWSWAVAGGAVTSVRATSDGGCIASGFQTSGSFGNEDAALVKLTTLGTADFYKSYGTAGNDRAYGVAATTPDGGYIFTGFAPGGGTTTNTDVYLLKTDPRGTVVK
ncbi:MAG: putative Ig domain-containing protein [Chitinispirillaceae bacterium]|jgi:hypothetical protein